MNTKTTKQNIEKDFDPTRKYTLLTSKRIRRIRVMKWAKEYAVLEHEWLSFDLFMDVCRTMAPLRLPNKYPTLDEAFMLYLGYSKKD